MKRATFCTVVLAAVLLVQVLPASAQKRMALVVGNGAYQNAAPLPNPANDARAVAEKLAGLGFDVHTAIDATQPALLEALAGFTAALDGAEAALFYYSGHGLQLGEENYLLPVDIKVANELSVRYGAVGITDILSDIERRAAVSLVILDACRDNPFAEDLKRAAGKTRSVAVSRGLARIRPTASETIIAYAAAAGDVASDGDGDHSPYTAAFLAEIDRPGAEVGLIFRRISGRVIAATDGDQRPELLVRLTREFYLSAPETVAVAAPPPPVASDGGQSATPAEKPSAEAGSEPAKGEQTVVAAPYDEPAAARQRRAIAPARWGYYAALTPPAIVRPNPPWQPPAGRTLAESADNDAIPSADGLGVNDTWRLTIHPAGDHDFAALTVGQAGMLALTATGLPPEIDLAARVLDGNLATTANWSGAPRPGGDFALDVDLPGPGTYYVEVADGRNDAESGAPVELTLAFTPSPDLYEPNNDIGHAWAVPIVDRREAAILPLGEADWFTVAAEAPGELTLTATQVPEALDVAFRVLDADDATVLNWTGAPRPGGDTYGVADLKRPGTYAIEVRDGRNDARSERPFILETAFVANLDPSEPNDTVGYAYDVPQDGVNGLTVFPVGDADWLAITVDQPGALEITATEVPENLDIAVRVLDSDLATVVNWTGAPRPGGDTYAVADLASPGRYFIEVRDGRNDARSITPFRFETRFTPASDQYEPNNTLGTAKRLTVGGQVAFNILPLGDADWFSVDVDTPGALAISVDEGPKDLDIAFRVLDANRGTVVNWTAPYAPGGLTEAVADLALPGTYYIEVRDGRNDARSVQHATLFTQFTPLIASYEPNDDRARATPVPLSGETYAHILPVGDADLFSVLVERPGTLDIEIDQVPEALDVAFRVLDASGGTIANWVSAPRPGGVTTGSASFARPGEYYIEVRDGRNDARDPAPFRIRRTFQPAG
jgi:uncharacterized caspase-like protein